MKFYVIAGIVIFLLYLIGNAYGHNRKRDDKELEQMFKKRLKRLGRRKETFAGVRRAWNWMKVDALVEEVAKESNRDQEEVRRILLNLCGQSGPFQMQRTGDCSDHNTRSCGERHLINPHFIVSLRDKE